MKKKNLKMISAVLAMITALTMVAAGCGNQAEDQDELVTNVITQAPNEDTPSVTEGTGIADNGDTPADTQAQTTVTEVVRDDKGNIVTEANGEPLTQVVTTTVPTADPDAEKFFSELATKPNINVDTSADSSTKYPYNTLTDDEKALYDAIVGAATNMSTRIFGAQKLSSAEWLKVFGLVYNQEPQLFWLNSKSVVGRLYYNEIDADKINAMQKEIDATVEPLLKEANGKSSTFEKLKVFHDYLVLNATFEEIEDKVNYNQTIYNAFAGGTSKQANIQCSGYAKAMQYLCDKAGIDCMVITGTNEKGTTHAWNKVKVEGEWYNLDCTWDDPIFSNPLPNYIRHTFFLVPDSWINEITHFNVNTVSLKSGEKVKYFDPPTASAESMNYFRKNGLVYDDRDSADKALKAALEKAVEENRIVAQIMVGSDELYNEIKSDLKSYQTYIKEKSSKVTGLAENCNETMRIIQLNVKY